MNCWICWNKCNKENLCNCNNYFSYYHKECLYKWIENSNNYVCKMCKNDYKISFYYYLKINLRIYINNIIELYENILKYDLYTGNEWDEYFI